MKNLLLFLMLIFGVLSSCRHNQELLPDSTPVSNSKSQSEPKLDIFPEFYIVSIHFPGIPDENVLIDHKNRTVIVNMPSVLTINDLTPIVECSENAKLALYDFSLSEIGRTINWAFPYANYLSIILTSKQPGNYPSIKYSIKPTTAKPIIITQSEVLPALAIGDSRNVYFNAQNLYGNNLPKSVTFTNKKSGKKEVLSGVYITPVFNKIGIYINFSPELGEHDIVFEMADGESVKVPQTLTVVPGTISYLENTYYSLEGQPGGKVTARGENLFEGVVSFRLLYPNGIEIPLNADYYLNGRIVDLAIPASLKPGYYGIEIVRSGIPLGRAYRLSVVRYELQPTIFSINEYSLPNYPTEEPLIVQLSRDVSILFRIRKPINRYVVLLENESNAASAFQFTLTLPIEAAPYFTISSTVPAGRYKAFIQEIDPVTKKVVQQSEPYERIVVLQ